MNKIYQSIGLHEFCKNLAEIKLEDLKQLELVEKRKKREESMVDVIELANLQKKKARLFQFRS